MIVLVFVRELRTRSMYKASTSDHLRNYTSDALFYNKE